MANFQRVSALKQWTLGSLVSDTGSEYLFGYDPAQGLMWLERPGQKYSSADPVWKEAEAYIRTSFAPARIEDPGVGEESGAKGGTGTPASNGHGHDHSHSGGAPRTVSRSVQTVQQSVAADGWDDPYPMEGDSRIVGDMSTSGKDVPDEDIAAQAAQFLMGLGEEDYDGE